MDAVALADLRRAFEAAREFTLYVGPEHANPRRSVTLRTPTEHQVRLAALRSRAGALGSSEVLHAQLERDLLEHCICNWAGMQAADIVEGQGGDLPFAPAVVPLLLDAQPGWFTVPAAELLRRLADRQERAEAGAKN